MSEDMALPEPNIEYRLAAALLGKKDDLDRRIVEALVGQPKRYSDLKVFLKGRRDHVLTKALARLRKNGLIDQGFDLADDRPERYYALTHLGVLAVLRMHEMKPVHESIHAARRGGLVDA